MPSLARSGIWLERWRYLLGQVEAGNWTGAGRTIVAGAWRLVSNRLRHARAERLLVRYQNSRPLDARYERLDSALRIVRKGSLMVRDGTAECLATIVIPCFNYGRYLEDAVTSARAQTIGCPEIIIVDDGSTDANTIEVIDALVGACDVKVIRQKNAGLPAARNAGIAAASGEYVCCLDADDTLRPTYLECCISALEADRSLGFCYSHVHLFGDEEGVWRTRPFDLLEARRNNHVAVSAVFRRDDALAIGGFDGDMVGGFEDWEFWLRLAESGRRGHCITTPLFNHRRHGRTMTHEAFDRRVELTGRIRARHRRFYSDRTWVEQLRAYHAAGDMAAEPPDTDWIQHVVRLPAGRRPLTVLAPFLPIGGGERILLAAVRELSRDHDIEILTTTAAPHHPMAKEFESITPRIFHLPDMLPERTWLPFVVARLRARGNGRVLMSGSTWGHLVAAEMKALVPNLRICDILHNDSADYHLPNAVRASPAIDMHIAGSQAAARALVGCGVPSDRVSYIRNGVDHKRFAPPSRDLRLAARRRFEIPKDALVLGFVGRLSEEKRPLEFLSILERVNAHTSVHGLVIGEGPLARAFGARRRRMSAPVEWYARLPDHGDLAVAYAAMDVLILPSAVEGLPLVVLEAQACGLPIAACDVGDVSQLVHSGSTGVLVPSDKPLLLADEVAALLRDPARRARFGAAARSHITEGGWTGAAMAQAYRQVVTGPE